MLRQAFLLVLGVLCSATVVVGPILLAKAIDAPELVIIAAVGWIALYGVTTSLSLWLLGETLMSAVGIQPVATAMILLAGEDDEKSDPPRFHRQVLLYMNPLFFLALTLWLMVAYPQAKRWIDQDREGALRMRQKIRAASARRVNRFIDAIKTDFQELARQPA